MDEAMPLDFRDLLTTAKQFLSKGIAPPKDKAITCKWSTNPTTGRLESHWANKPDLPEIVINGIL